MLNVLGRHCQAAAIRLPHTFKVRLAPVNQPLIVRRNYHLIHGKSRNYKYAVCQARWMSAKSASEVRFVSSGVDDVPSLSLQNIPEPPVPVSIDDIAATVATGEPSLTSLGLGGYSPVGLIQNCLEFLHITLDIPWWGAIMIGTICVRIIVFPVVIIAQRNSAAMNNNLPQIQHLQLKMTNARKTGNQLDAARYGQEMMSFMKEKKLNPLKNMIAPMMQMPFFISFFLGLRGMANCPVESMTHGGLFWFSDLTIPDPYFLLPIFTSATLLLTIELGVDGGRLTGQNMHMLKYVLRALPLVMIPFTINFPGAILMYWFSSNTISLVQVGVLKIPQVRDYFKIPKLIMHNPESLPIPKKGFVAGAKDSWDNLRISKEMEDRQKLDEMIFNKAGRGPIVKTYKTNPRKSLNAIQAKQTDK